MKVLITGHKGFIGAHLVDLYKSGGHEVEGIDIKDGDDLLNIPKYFYDMTFDLIIHCASFCTIRDCIKDPEKCCLNNSHITQNILEYARKTGCDKFVYFSSSRILYENNNPYTADKKYGELLCKAYKECYDIDYIIIRPSTVFGERDDTDRLIPRFVNKAIKGEDLVIFGNYNKTLDVTYIGDFLKAFENIMFDDVWSTEWNIGSGKEVKVADIAEHIKISLNSPSSILYSMPEISQPQNTLINIMPLRNIGYRVVYGWKIGVDRTIWYWLRKLNMI